MKHDLAPRSSVHNLEMAVAYALPVGVGLFASLYAMDASWLTTTIGSTVGFFAILGCVLFLMRPIPGSLTIAEDGLRIVGNGLRLTLPWSDLRLETAQRLTGAVPNNAMLVFVTDSRRAVVLERREGGKIVLSPQDPAAFLRQLAMAGEPVTR